MSEMTTSSNWHRSSRCETAACVEVALINGAVAVRDSKRSDGPILLFTRGEWAAFIAGASDGEFDLDDGSAG